MEAHFLKAAACALVFLLFAFAKGGPEVQAQEQRSYDPALFEELAETSDDEQEDGLGRTLEKSKRHW